MAPERGRYALDTVYIGPEGVVTTGGRQLVISRYAKGVTPPTHGFLMPNATRKDGAKLKGKATVTFERRGQGRITVTWCDEKTGRKTAITEELAAHATGIYPDWPKVLEGYPKGTLCVSVDVHYLLQAVRTAERFVKERATFSDRVLLMVRPPQGNITSVEGVKAVNTAMDLLVIPDQQDAAPHGAAVLVMPMDMEEKDLARALQHNPLKVASMGPVVLPDAAVEQHKQAEERKAARELAAQEKAAAEKKKGTP